ncbi:hypothetical protein [Gorillibacterium sp. CAU 1737]|uniref:hypothetical protein n=1 Tax=Gorillibacterium sp. CAU 1737 TaxID=3140362 RepID=UPI003260672A
MEQNFNEMGRSELVKTLRSHYGFVTEEDNGEDSDWAILEQWECMLDGAIMKKPTIE